MDQSELIIKIFLTIVFGAILGLEAQTREVEKKGKKQAAIEEHERLGGLRTYTLLSLMGGIAGLFYTQDQGVLVYMLFGSIILFLLSAYILNVQQKHAFGLTTEFAVLITFIIGFLTTSSIVPIGTVIVVLVLLAFFVSQKQSISKFVTQIEHKEIIDLVKFGLVSLVVLPLLPNQDFFISDFLHFIGINNFSGINSHVLNISIINPFKTWLIVSLISGFNLLGYLLGKIMGSKRSTLISGILGGFISSTATTIALARKSQKQKNDVELAGSAVVATSVSFFPLLLLLFISSPELFSKIAPIFLSMILIGLITGLIMTFWKNNIDEKSDEIHYEPFSVTPAIKFVILLVSIKLIVQLLQLGGIENLYILFTSLSGFIGLDAATIAIAELNSQGNLVIEMAILGVILANIVNFIAKILYSEAIGSRKFGFYVMIGLLITLLGNFAYFFF